MPIVNGSQHSRAKWFSERRIQASKDSAEPKHYKGSASDVLSFHRILALFVETRLLPLAHMAEAAESFLTLSDFVAECFAAKEVGLARFRQIF